MPRHPCKRKDTQHLTAEQCEFPAPKRCRLSTASFAGPIRLHRGGRRTREGRATRKKNTPRSAGRDEPPPSTAPSPPRSVHPLPPALDRALGDPRSPWSDLRGAGRGSPVQMAEKKPAARVRGPRQPPHLRVPSLQGRCGLPPFRHFDLRVRRGAPREGKQCPQLLPPGSAVRRRPRGAGAHVTRARACETAA